MSLSQAIVVAALALQLSLAALVAHAEVKIDRATFFAKCGELVKTKKSFQAMDRGKLTTFYLRATVISGDGKANIERIFNYIEKVGYPTDQRQIAYILGTAYRETMGYMVPIHEVPGCRTEACIHRNVGAYGQPANNGNSYYGRGFVQLTHAYNYTNVGKELGLNPQTALYDNPDLALDPDYAVRILVEGMYRGLFTPRRKRLDDYFNATIEDWDGARQIVNPGSRRAPVTAGYGRLFWECLTGNTQRAPVDRRASASLQGVGLRPTGWWVTPQTARLSHPTYIREGV